LLTEDDVKVFIRKGECDGTAFTPLNRGFHPLVCQGPRHGEHASIEIDTCHPSCGAYPVRGIACDSACPTRHVKDTLA
jgi:hypothetical protein